MPSRPASLALQEQTPDGNGSGRVGCDIEHVEETLPSLLEGVADRLAYRPGIDIPGVEGGEQKPDGDEHQDDTHDDVAGLLGHQRGDSDQGEDEEVDREDPLVPPSLRGGGDVGAPECEDETHQPDDPVGRAHSQDERTQADDGGQDKWYCEGHDTMPFL